MSEKRKSKILTSQSKEIVLNVSNYFEREAENPSATPASAYIVKTSEATSVSESTIRRIRKEKKETGQVSSPKKPPAEPWKPIDDFDKCVIRNKIHEFYTVRRQLPTISLLLESLKTDINFDGSRSLLLKIVKELGFSWKRSSDGRKLLTEKYAIVDRRCQYLRKVDAFRKQGRNMVYIDETWIDTGYTAKSCWQSTTEIGVTVPVSRGQRLIIVHGGSKSGFVPGALLIYKATSATGDYHHEMNGDNFKKWFIEKLLPNIKENNSIIVMDNASYHSMKSEKCPTTATRKADIQDWLRSHNIQFDEKMLRPELLALARANKPEPKFIIDDIAKQHGHEILRLPPYHPDLNPIEMIWSQVKNMVASKNFTHRLDDLMKLTQEVFEHFPQENWESTIAHVEKLEEDYRKKDIVIDEEMEPFIINLAESSSSENDEEQ